VDAIGSRREGSKVEGLFISRSLPAECLVVKGNRGFDEVMIVNPTEPNGGGRFMRFHYGQPLEMGYYGEPPEMYGEYDPVGYYAEEPYVGEDPYVSEYYPYGEADPYGYYAEAPELYGWGEPEPYGEYDPVGYYAEDPYVGEDPYGEVEPYGYYAESPEMYGWGEPEISGYVRDVPPAFNAGCPMPSNVAGFGEAQPLEGYVRPGEVSPSCKDFTPQPGPTPAVPETFKPLW
jgi:hypothetical protein